MRSSRQLPNVLVGCLVALMAVSTAFAQSAGPPAATDETTLLARFDTQLDAEHAVGSPAVESSGASLVDGGKWGRALSIAPDGFVSFDPAGNLGLNNQEFRGTEPPRITEVFGDRPLNNGSAPDLKGDGGGRKHGAGGPCRAPGGAGRRR